MMSEKQAASTRGSGVLSPTPNTQHPTPARKRILVLSKAGVGTMMSSPGIRALNIARVLGRALPEAEVVLAVPGSTDLVPDAPFRVQTYTARTLPRLVLGFDIVISQGFPPTVLPVFFGRKFVMDFFTNFLIEGLEYRREHVTPSVRQAWLDTQRAYLNLQLTMADFVICANERQRDAWLGMMSCLGLIPGDVYDRDNTLESLVGVAAYGVRPTGVGSRESGVGRELPLRQEARPNVFAQHHGATDDAQAVPPPTPDSRLPTPFLKGAFPGIAATDRVILWNGGIVRWYDPLTLVRAVARIVPRRPEVKLLFLGTKYPVVGFDPGAMLGEARALSRELGLLGENVLFNEGWLPYDESGQYMVEADIGVSTYYDNLETHFSYRTRLVDFLWAETPVVCTRGDVIAEMVERRGLGVAVPEGDVDALEAALLRLLDDRDFYDGCKRNLRAIKDELQWERTLAPLVEFCRNETSIARGKWWRAPDLLSRTARYVLARAVERAQAKRAGAPVR
ncbi:MAG: glycosyltransferase [Chloroflexi bacterium]|nr:glycosyltransferase [Chloroflexota bacterium]